MQLDNHKNDLNKNSEKFSKFISEKTEARIETLSRLYSRAFSRWLLYNGENMDGWKNSVDIFTTDNDRIKHSFFLDSNKKIIASFGKDPISEKHRNDIATYFSLNRKDLFIDYYLPEENYHFYIITKFKKDQRVEYLVGEIDLIRLFERKLSSIDEGFSCKIEDYRGKQIVEKNWGCAYANLESRYTISILNSRKWLVRVAPTKVFANKQTRFLLITPFLGVILGLFISFLFYQIYTSRQLTKELERHKFHLEEIIEERTSEILRSNKELEQFAYVASHDLQEPLRMVSSYTQLLADKYRDKLDKKANEYIYYAVDGATRMQQLINDLLSYSRINSQGNAFSEVDSLSVLKEALKNLSKMIEESGAVITNDDLPSVIADKFQVLQVFQNLIGNGIKFHKPEEIPHIHISAEIKGKKAIFSIKDNGIGIEKKYLSQIFDIFQRLHTRSEYSGTGIGLAVCKRIINRHGGEIWIESESGKGSTFYFYLKKS